MNTIADTTAVTNLIARYAELVVRDLRVQQILEGNNENMRVIVARGLTEALG
ncbi:hypothetical protein ACWDGI_09320 [Streptomyces sp. NPDC001220]